MAKKFPIGAKVYLVYRELPDCEWCLITTNVREHTEDGYKVKGFNQTFHDIDLFDWKRTAEETLKQLDSMVEDRREIDNKFKRRYGDE